MIAVGDQAMGTSMRATNDQPIITQFGDLPVAPRYCGRRSVQITSKVSTRIVIAFAAALIGCATAATAVTVKNNSTTTERSISAGANMGGVAGTLGFEAALY